MNNNKDSLEQLIFIVFFSCFSVGDVILIGCNMFFFIFSLTVHDMSMRLFYIHKNNQRKTFAYLSALCAIDGLLCE